MTDVILWIMDKWPILGMGLLLIVLVVVITVRVMKWKHSIETKTDCIPDTFKKLPCEEHIEVIESHKDVMKEIRSGVSSLNVRVDSMSDNLSDISKWIMKFDPSTIDTLAMKHSPMKMTTAGLQLYEISGAQKAMMDNAEFLLGELQKINPSTPFDVEDKAFDVLMKNLSLPLFNPIKNYIYYQPDKVTLKTESGEDVTVTLSLMAIVKLMSLDLRDRYLAAHPEIEEKNEDRQQ